MRQSSLEAQRAADRQIAELQSSSRDLNTRVEQLQRRIATTPTTPTTPVVTPVTPIVTPAPITPRGRRTPRKKPPKEE